MQDEGGTVCTAGGPEGGCEGWREPLCHRTRSRGRLSQAQGRPLQPQRPFSIAAVRGTLHEELGWKPSIYVSPSESRLSTAQSPVTPNRQGIDAMWLSGSGHPVEATAPTQRLSGSAIVLLFPFPLFQGSWRLCCEAAGPRRSSGQGPPSAPLPLGCYPAASFGPLSWLCHQLSTERQPLRSSSHLPPFDSSPIPFSYS